MYWLTRSSITFHAEMTTIGVVNAVSRTNQTERPSTPSVYQTLKRAIHACFSTNCIAAVPRSKPGDERKVTAKLAIDAIERRPAHRVGAIVAAEREQQRSETMGSQMAMLRRGMLLLFARGAQRPMNAAEERPELPRHEADDADDHDERVPVR